MKADRLSKSPLFYPKQALDVYIYVHTQERTCRYHLYHVRRDT